MPLQKIPGCVMNKFRISRRGEDHYGVLWIDMAHIITVQRTAYISQIHRPDSDRHQPSGKKHGQRRRDFTPHNIHALSLFNNGRGFLDLLQGNPRICILYHIMFIRNKLLKQNLFIQVMVSYFF